MFQRIPSFPDLSQILSELCQFGDVTDNISLDAAVALGKLCVADENAKSKLRQVLSESGSTHVKAQVRGAGGNILIAMAEIMVEGA